MARSAGSNGARTNEAVRAAAIRLIAEHGYEAMSLRMLSEKLGFRPAALYHYFASKQELLYSLMYEHMNDLLESWEHSKPQSEDPLKQLIAFVHFHIEHHMDRKDEVFISYMELRSLDADNYKIIVGLRRRYEQVLNSILERGAARALFQIDDVRMTTMSIIAMLTGANVWYRRNGRLSREQIMDNYTRLVLRSVFADAIACRQAGQPLSFELAPG